MLDGAILNPPEVPNCFVCGPANPEGLGLEIRRDGTDAVAIFTPRAIHQGYPERVHGGLVAMLVDEMLVYAGAPHGIWGMTAKVSYRLRRPIPLGTALALRGRLIRRTAGAFRAEVEVRLPDGSLAADGEGTCVERAGAGHEASAPAPGGPRSDTTIGWDGMEVRSRQAADPFTTADGSTIRSLLDLSNAPVEKQSLAEATIEPSAATVRHYHRELEEIYYLVSGTGTMEIDGIERQVGPGDAVLIPPGSWHQITADGHERLRFLCCCAPPYRHEDTFFD